MGLLDKNENTVSKEEIDAPEAPVFKVLDMEEKRETEMDAFLEEDKDFKKTFFNGYNKNDVDEYIEILKSNMSRVQKQLSDEIRGITAEKANVVNERNVLRNQLKKVEKAKDDALEDLKELAHLEETIVNKEEKISALKEENQAVMEMAEKAESYREMIVECEEHIQTLEAIQREKEEEAIRIQEEAKKEIERVTEGYEEKIREMKEAFDAERDAHAKTREACFKAEEELRAAEKTHPSEENAEKTAQALKEMYDRQLKEKEMEISRLKSAANTLTLVQSPEESHTEMAEMLKKERACRLEAEKKVKLLSEYFASQEGNMDVAKSGTEEKNPDQENSAQMYEKEIAELRKRIAEMEEEKADREDKLSEMIDSAARSRENLLKRDYEERVRQNKENYNQSIHHIEEMMKKRSTVIRQEAEKAVTERYEEKIRLANAERDKAKKEGLSFKDSLEDIMKNIDETKVREAMRMEQSVADRKKIAELLYEIAKLKLDSQTAFADEEVK